jgi:amino acid transporter
MLQVSFIAAVPQQLLTHGWQSLNYPGVGGPLVGLALLLGLSTVALLLMIDSAFSPFGTTLVYTAATSRIVYGMALNHHLPSIFLKTNRHKIPYVTLYVNFLVGVFSFLPFPGWQKLVAFLSSASILSYGIGPICLLAMRKLQPDTKRPFKLSGSLFMSHVAFYFCNLMLYWCGFGILWKLDIALLIGLIIYLMYHRKPLFSCGYALYWFIAYMTSLSLVSFLGAFGGIGLLTFPLDILSILPLSIVILYLSQALLDRPDYKQIKCTSEELLV